MVQKIVLLSLLACLVAFIQAALVTSWSNPFTAMYAWGQNSNGQLGNGLVSYTQLIPVLVLVNTSDVTQARSFRVKQLVTGLEHVMALDDLGQLYTWGCNNVGALGNGLGTSMSNTNPPQLLPMRITVPKQNNATIVSIATTGQHSVVLDSAGVVYTFGSNRYGQLGNGVYGGGSFGSPVVQSRSPILVRTVRTPMENKTIVAIAAGQTYTFAIDNTGSIYSWGNNENRQLGQDKISWLEPLPGLVVTQGTPMENKTIIAISAGAQHTVALDSTGAVYTWGSGQSGELGNGKTKMLSPVPLAVITQGTSMENKTIIAISAGTGFTVALDSTGAVHAWGAGSYGVLGQGISDYNSKSLPVLVKTKGTPMENKTIVAIAAGISHVIALDSTGTVFAWGAGFRGQLGSNDTQHAYLPIKVMTIGTPMENKTITSIAAGGEFSMVISGSTMCNPGLYKSDMSTCTACAAGTYSFTYDATSCISFPKGTISGKGSTQCNACKAGTYSSSDGTRCIPCDPGHFAGRSGLASCLLCSPGSFSTFGSTECTTCSAGSYSLGAQGECTPCPIGTFSNQEGATSRVTCQQCPVGTASNITGAPTDAMCIPCKPGSFATQGSSVCTLCAPGSFTSQFNSPQCFPCSDGHFSPETGSTACSACASGFQSSFDHKGCILDSKVIVAIVVPISIVVLCVVSLVAVISISALVVARKARQQKLRDDALRKSLLEEDALAEGEIELQPQFNIDLNLFKVNFHELRQLREIGAGGSGAVVYRAKWNDESCAVKLFKTRNFATEYDYREFEKELQLMSSLRHPNVVLFLGACMQAPRVGIVLEFCDHGSLDDYLQRHKGSLSLQRKLQILLDIARGVNFLHARGIVHRDLKLGNALVDKNHTVKLADFGLSKRKQELLDKQTRGVGTSYYMAPEVTLGRSYDEKVDSYSFGIMMSELLLEQVNPYGELSSFSVEMRVAQDPNFRPSVPDAVRSVHAHAPYVALMEQCWSHDPIKRPSFQNIVITLEQMLFDVQNQSRQ